MTSVMLETARKGYWNASDKQLNELVQMHAELVKNYDAGCSGFVCNNIKLRQYILEKLPADLSEQYNQAIDKARNVQIDEDPESVVLKKEKEEMTDENQPNNAKNYKTDKKLAIIVLAVIIILLLIAIYVRKQKKENSKK
jgi:cobaltochelatase CobN